MAERSTEGPIMPTLNQISTAVIVILGVFVLVAAARIYIMKRPTRYDRRANVWECLRATIVNSTDMAIVGDVTVSKGTYRFVINHETVNGWVLFTPMRRGSLLEIETPPKSREVHETLISDPTNEAQVMALFQHTVFNYEAEKPLPATPNSKLSRLASGL